MSTNEIPFHIQEEIIKKLPIKSLVRFRSVSKTWKFLIDSPEFIAAHTLRYHTHPHHLLVSYQDPFGDANFVYYIDDDTFPQKRSILTLPLSIKQLIDPIILSISRGLVCFYPRDRVSPSMTLIWNPLIRKSIIVAIPPTYGVGVEFGGFGFGVCPITNDPKVVLFLECSSDVGEPSYINEVMVYTLSSRKWRSLPNNLRTNRLQVNSQSVVNDRFIYWCSWSYTHKAIVSFDVTTERFEVIDLPDSLSPHDSWVFSMFNLREYIAVVKLDENNDTSVWMMERGVEISFTKLFTINELDGAIVGFRKNGVPIVQVTRAMGIYESNDYAPDACRELVVYEPNLEHNNILESCGPRDPFNVNSYMETLLLLGRSDCDSYLD